MRRYGHCRAVAFRASDDEVEKIYDNTREPTNSSYKNTKVDEHSKEEL